MFSTHFTNNSIMMALHRKKDRTTKLAMGKMEHAAGITDDK
jgi:hypothetical protein